MTAVELTKENFTEIVGGTELVFLDFWASWCMPCRTFGPIFEEVAENHPDAVFGTVDTDAQRELAASFRVMSIPTLVIMREGVVLYAKSGALSRQALEDLVARARALDMDELAGTGQPVRRRPETAASRHRLN